MSYEADIRYCMEHYDMTRQEAILAIEDGIQADIETERRERDLDRILSEMEEGE